MDVAAGIVAGAAIISAQGADVPEGPPRDGGSVRDIARVSLEEVNLVERVMVAGTGEKGEEDEEDGAGGEDEGKEGEEGA